MTTDIYNKEFFYSDLWLSDKDCYYYDRCLKPEHLKPVEDFLLEGRCLTPYSKELSLYLETRRCVLDFDIYVLEDSYRVGNTGSVELMMECYRYAANNRVYEAYNNIGVFYAMTDRLDMALPYWKKGAQNGSVLAWINLMDYFYSQKDYEDVLFCLNNLKKLKHPLAFWNLALSHHFGFLGIHPDISRAEKLYKEMMSLVPRDEKEESEGGSSELLNSKTMACYNLARMRFLTEEHTEDNLESILHLLTRTPYVLLDEPKSNQLIDEIEHIKLGSEQRVR